MSSINIQKMGMAFGLLAFGFLAVGSVLMGSRVITGVLRGGLGAIIFGGLVWIVADLFLAENEGDLIHDVVDDNNPDKGTQLDDSA
jgi:hypothetical protein